eukprot:3683428-Prymnesium_polylepis.1
MTREVGLRQFAKYASRRLHRPCAKHRIDASTQPRTQLVQLLLRFARPHGLSRANNRLPGAGPWTPHALIWASDLHDSG